MAASFPKLVYIDDKVDLVEDLKHRLEKCADVTAITSSLEKLADIKEASQSADIVISDWDLDGSLLAQPGLGYEDGGALIEGVASWRRSSDFIHIIFSGQLEQIEALQEVETELFGSHLHILARRLGVDWVGQKNRSEPFYKSLESCAAAVQRIGAMAGAKTSTSIDRLRTLLGSSDGSGIEDELVEEIPAYGPPPIELIAARRFDVIRWLLLEILPYPTFLIDAEELARRIGVKYTWFKKDDCNLRAKFIDAEYKGILNDVGLGKRWWTQRVESRLWELSEGQTVYGDAWRERLVAMGVPFEELLQCSDPAIPRGYFGVSTGRIIDVSDAIRINPPHWPSAAGQAYAQKSDVLADEFLQQIADPSDLASAE